MPRREAVPSSRKGGQTPDSPSPERRGGWGVRFAVAFVGLWALWPGGAPRSEAASSAEPASPHAAPASHTLAAAQRRPGTAARPSELVPSEARRERAREALSAFLDRTRYPPGSRPMSERPDLALPNFVPPRSLPVGRTAEDRRRVVLTQDRMDVAPGESATVTVACLEGQVEVPCSLDEAHWHAPGTERTGTLPFRPRGASGGVLSADVDPAALGLEGLSLPLFLETTVHLGADAVPARFELTLTGKAPAHFTGEVRAALEQGSIALHVGVAVDEPGRYVVRARVGEEPGALIAYLSETVALAPGEREVQLTLFGKLLRDEDARGPLVLRDVEGHRLLPDTYPDRERMPTWRGVMSRLEAIPLEDLSDAPWESPEKARMQRMLETDAAR